MQPLNLNHYSPEVFLNILSAKYNFNILNRNIMMPIYKPSLLSVLTSITATMAHNTKPYS